MATLGTTRRAFLQFGGGLGLASCLPTAAWAANTSGRSPIRSCIFVFHYGGPSQLETWDPKPDAPAEVRGPFQPIATSAGGVRIGEHLPRMARQMHHVALARSLHHPMRNHNSAAAQMLTGKTPLRGDLELLADDPLQPPCYGAALSAAGGRRSELSHVALPHTMYNVVQLPGQTAGFLGAGHERFQIEGNPNDPNFNVRMLQLPGEIPPERLQQRESLLKSLETPSKSPNAGDLPAFYEQAFSTLHSTALQRALQIAAEPAALRDEYGRTQFGQSLVLARRLVEAGVRMITVFDGRTNCQTCNWDSHADNFGRHKDALMPPLDQGLSTLIADLDQRGLLSSTLVISVGEFGRTPIINGSGGRDHWPDCFTALLAGGGTPGGTIFGESDRLAAYPARDPVGPGDLAATLFSRFGIDPHYELRDAAGRRHPLAEGQPLF